ncbi:hypothetical protein FN846DRAFT_634297 [Sphaerosporella brunnea]|uniref:Uncharacterized protein n=1 Tax=Sphaerosporella brunnea TaxID=1250544 RepID=A0A5J5F1E8_9PEZI|nr:hypothetical protein FN846DRAFT_634297 [Sphaerosporella brunnea]
MHACVLIASSEHAVGCGFPPSSLASAHHWNPPLEFAITSPAPIHPIGAGNTNHGCGSENIFVNAEGRLSAHPKGNAKGESKSTRPLRLRVSHLANCAVCKKFYGTSTTLRLPAPYLLAFQTPRFRCRPADGIGLSFQTRRFISRAGLYFTVSPYLKLRVLPDTHVPQTMNMRPHL